MECALFEGVWDTTKTTLNVVPDDTPYHVPPKCCLPFQELGTLPDDTPYHLNVVSSITNRLQWLKREIRSQRKQEKKLQQDLVDTMNVSEKDRSILIQEIEKKEEKMTELIDIKDELMQRDDENLDAVVLLNEKLKDISDQLHIQKLTEDARIKELITVEKKETEVEKAGIEERYTKLKETMRQLQEDLRDTRLNTYVSDGSGDPGSNLHIKNHKNATTKDRTRESPSQIKRRTSPHRLLDDSSNRKHSVDK